MSGSPSPSPAADFDRIGARYSQIRRPDPRLATAVATALGHAGRILNVGAGAGAYEPLDGEMVAAEPSVIMLGQHRGQCRVQATAGSLPFSATGSRHRALAPFGVSAGDGDLRAVALARSGAGRRPSRSPCGPAVRHTPRLHGWMSARLLAATRGISGSTRTRRQLHVRHRARRTPSTTDSVS
jgi:hypothetical protein